MTLALARDLERVCPGGVSQGVSLASFTRWRIGGEADLVVEPASIAELQGLRRYLARVAAPFVVIGSTSNLLFADAGLRAVCIRIGRRMSRIVIEDDQVRAQAGTWAPHLARAAMHAGLSGVEHVSGIPGSLGGLIVMNGGSQRQSISSALIDIASVTADGELAVRAREACGFAYRTSYFQSADEIVAEARLRLPRGESKQIRAQMRSLMAARRRKFPLRLPNCGSVFISDPALYESLGPPGAAIEKLGLKGLRIGDAEVSPLHANFIVNRGGAKAEDVLALIARVRAEVLRETGHALKAEVRYVDPQGSVCAAHEAAGAH